MNRARAALLISVLAAAGCGEAEQPNRSATAAEDPAKYEAAKAESARIEQEAREAEKAATGGKLSVEQ